jgi:hypothetical protein
MKITTELASTTTWRADAFMAAAPRAIVFIDGAIDGWQDLVAGLTGSPQVVLLDPEEDGVGQMSAALASCRDLDSIHILAPSLPGCLRLGATNLSLATLYWHADLLAGWRPALGPRAEILIHGGEVGVGAEGEALLRRLRELTGAEPSVAATPSDSPTIRRSSARGPDLHPRAMPSRKES